MKHTLTILTALLLAPLAVLHTAETTTAQPIDRETLDDWSAPYRGWHCQPDHVIFADPKNETFYLYYCACGSKGRGIRLLTSKTLTNNEATEK